MINWLRFIAVAVVPLVASTEAVCESTTAFYCFPMPDMISTLNLQKPQIDSCVEAEAVWLDDTGIVVLQTAKPDFTTVSASTSNPDADRHRKESGAQVAPAGSSIAILGSGTQHPGTDPSPTEYGVAGSSHGNHIMLAQLKCDNHDDAFRAFLETKK